MRRSFLVGFLILAAFVGINVAFFQNLKNLPYANYYLLLLAINIDLLALVVVSAIILRKLIKVYLGRKKNILRRKLANILFLYLFLPILILNLVSMIVILHSTKTFLSSKTHELSSSAVKVYRDLFSLELSKVDRYRRILSVLLEKGLMEEVNRLGEVESVVEVPECSYEVSEGEFVYNLCITAGERHYRVALRKDVSLIQNISTFGKLALDVRAFVKTRDIITGIYVFLIVFISLITLLATVWLGMLVARHISEPIENLSERAMDIAGGNLEAPVDIVRTGDEIEDLFRAFHSMRENLKAMYDQLVRERDLLERLLDALPVGVLYKGPDGVKTNRTFKAMFGDARDPEEAVKEARSRPNLRVEEIQAAGGKVYIFEDVGSLLLAERFRTWQEAVKRIAHEIKNPLTPIRLNLERIARITEVGEIDPEKLRNLTKAILKEIERINDLISQFRHLSTERDLKPKEIRISDLVNDLRQIYSSAGLDIDLKGDERILADPAMLKEMFYNLINNSLEWGASKVEVEVRDGEIHYRDNGKGIGESEVENIFIPYYSKNPKGMGIGMAVVKRIAEDHGWAIKAIPSKEGAYFLIDLRSRS